MTNRAPGVTTTDASVHLRCIRCRREIMPEDRMVLVMTLIPAQFWATVHHSLDHTPAWHWQCAPVPVRQYAPPILVNTSAIKALVVAGIAAIVVLAFATRDAGASAKQGAAPIHRWKGSASFVCRLVH